MEEKEVIQLITHHLTLRNQFIYHQQELEKHLEEKEKILFTI
jgi:hypothetical protein